MGIDPVNLPDNSPSITYAFNTALLIVNPALRSVAMPCFAGDPPISLYNQAVYNLAADNLLNWAIDPSGQNYFERTRAELKIANWQAGVVSATTDATTAVTLEIMEAAKGFTMANLQQIKTPYGRQYIAISQDYGEIWGIS